MGAQDIESVIAAYAAKITELEQRIASIEKASEIAADYGGSSDAINPMGLIPSYGDGDGGADPDEISVAEVEANSDLNGKLSIKGFNSADSGYISSSETEITSGATDEEFVCRLNGAIAYRKLKTGDAVSHQKESDTNITFRTSGDNLYVGVYYS